MAVSMNDDCNWLSFSISPSSLHSLSAAAAVPHLLSAGDSHDDDDDDVSAAAACFALSSSTASSDPPLPSYYPFSEALIAASSSSHHQQRQNWTTFFNGGSSELSMLVGSSKRSRIEEEEEEEARRRRRQPKLEDFLGGNGFISELHPSFTATSGSCSSCDNSTTNAWFATSRGLQSSSSPTAAAIDPSSTSGDECERKKLLQVESVNGGGGQLMDSQVAGAAEAAPPRINGFGQRTSIYRGVTRHRWTGRYEAHLWDNSVKREGQTRKGRQVYLGGYDKEEKAARAYDLAALKYWGPTTITNFPINKYEKEVEEMQHMTRQEFIASLRRKSSGFSRGASIYRGVTRHHQHGRWQARIGRVAGNKDLYLGTFSTQEEAAEAYDIAAIRFRGLNAVTNFDMNRYDVKRILESDALPVGAAASSKRLRDAASDQFLPATAGCLDFRRRSGDEDDCLLPQLYGIGAAAGSSLHHRGWPPPTIAFHHPREYPYAAGAIATANTLHDYADQLHLGPSSSSMFSGDFVTGYARILQSSLDPGLDVGGGHGAPFLTVWDGA